VLNSQLWQEVSPYLDQALAMPAEEHEAWLVSLCAQNPALAELLKSLLEEHEVLSRERFLDETPQPLSAAQVLTGQTIGAYALVAPIGRGGMGSVWLAERSDGRFERQAAVKFLNIALAGLGGEERFKREGSILARLAHPHIAQLLDAGVSPSGQPYLILEYVEGEDIVRYCDAHRLEVGARLRLFLDVLAGVAHAHANLVVHRDIKPSNVLVTRDGNVKLLDFGIAKLLEEEAGSGTATQLTREGGGALTPLFAAPEQVTGGPVTTSTDVYACGVLLYELLTGQHPAGPGLHSPAELVKAIVETDAPHVCDVVVSHGAATEAVRMNATQRATTPEKLCRLLRGDVDTIVAKALKKNPVERYASATALADDLHRYLKHEPISARPDTLAYRAATFFHRNRTAVLLAGSALVLVITSLSAGLYVANHERKIAERRFVQVRQLANKFIELDADIRGLPGATKVRSRMVVDSLQYLTSLGSEVHGDKDLALEIALAYVRVAHVQGDPTAANLGQFAEAEATLQKAENFVDSVLATAPRDRQGLFIAATIAHDRMCLADAQGRRDETLAWADTTVARVDRFMSLINIDPKDVYSMGYFETNVAFANANNRRFDEALRASRRAFDIIQPVPSAHRLEGGILGALAIARWQTGDLEGAEQTAHQATVLQDQEAAGGHASLRLNLADHLCLEGMILGKEDAEPSLGRTSDALVALRRGMDIAEELARKDPDDERSRRVLAETALEIGNILRHTQARKALAVYDHAIARVRETKLNADRQHNEAELFAASSYAERWIGRDQEAQKRIDAALKLLRDAHKLPADKVEPMSDTYHALRALADEYAERGQTAEAVAAYQDLLDKLVAWKPHPETDLRDAICISRTWTALSDLLRHAGRAQDAARLESQRADLWRHWQVKLPNSEFLLRQSLQQIIPRGRMQSSRKRSVRIFVGWPARITTRLAAKEYRFISVGLG